jgi:hypothetical protein
MPTGAALAYKGSGVAPIKRTHGGAIIALVDRAEAMAQGPQAPGREEPTAPENLLPRLGSAAAIESLTHQVRVGVTELRCSSTRHVNAIRIMAKMHEPAIMAKPAFQPAVSTTIPMTMLALTAPPT